MSIAAAADNGVEAQLSRTGIKLAFGNKVIACGTRISDSLYSMDFETIVNASANTASSQRNRCERFDHANYKAIRQLANGLAFNGTQVISKSNTDKETSSAKRVFLCFVKNRSMIQTLEQINQAHLYILTFAI